MKKRLISIVIVLLVAFCSMSTTSSATSFNPDPWNELEQFWAFVGSWKTASDGKHTYSYVLSGDDAIITDYLDKYDDRYVIYSYDENGEKKDILEYETLYIPDYLDGHKVIGIGDGCYRFYDFPRPYDYDDLGGVVGTFVEEWGFSFSGSLFIKRVVIPDTVTFIEAEAFLGCPELESFSIGASLYGYGADTIDGYEIDVADDNPVYASKDGVLFSKDMTTLLSCPFSKTSYHVPSSVTRIASGAFSHRSLTSVTIGNNVRSIGSYAFNGCGDLSDITIPDTVTSIGYNAFTNTAYYNDESNWEDGALYIGNHLIIMPDSAEYTIKTGTVTIADREKTTFVYSNLKSVTIPNTIRAIGRHSFYNCKGLTNLVIPDSVISIGEEAFGNCSGLISVSLGENVTSIDRYAFCNCSNLKYINIPESVTSIGAYAFRDCAGLSSITIPKSVEQIGEYALGYYIYYWNSYSKYDGFTIYGYTDTAAETYADENSFNFIALDEKPEPKIGDADGDGEIGSIDVTYIQRYCVLMDTGIDEEKLMNADVDKNGLLEIIDATFIQRHLAGMEIPYTIG